MYAKHSKNPSQCIHLAFHNASHCDPHPSSALTICGAFLFHPPPKSLTPICRFAVQSLPAWVARLLCYNHRTRAKKSRNAAAMKEKTKILLEHGVRYIAFLKLPAYRNIIENHVVDSMHNWLLGLLGICLTHLENESQL
ncbi:hypothetical protein MJO28_015309 [Puccinia striiformis f. sp. tritici]|uniref:Uncharacterized protein n=1 Tax=Puccinia striiformis f. sp. tritici TaxID=168172 RepID=A0ACC0DS51_9BASI|nr:hypothetical protein MJO28_015309 [Puccinia striiformis f. sp. tritici]